MVRRNYTKEPSVRQLAEPTVFCALKTQKKKGTVNPTGGTAPFLNESANACPAFTKYRKKRCFAENRGR